MMNFRGLLLALPLFVSAASFSQKNNLEMLDSLSGNVIRQIRQNETEKAYLVTDKTIYTAGEQLWFRSFLVRSAAEKISTRSNYLFVDLVDEKDSALCKSVLYAKTQQTGGSMQLPGTLPTGHYWLRAFTRSMINGFSQGAAVVPVYVVNPDTPNPARTAEKAAAVVANEPPLTIQVFPEGGAVVTGINTAVGILVYDKSGNPLSLAGTIRDNMEAVAASFTTTTLGLGRAEFSPDNRRRYKAVVMHEGKEISVPLPAFNPYSGQLSVRRASNGLLTVRTVLEDSIYQQKATTYLLGISRDSLCFASTGTGNYETAVPTSGFPAGIVTFLLFDASFRLLSERSVYISESPLQLTPSLDKTVYTRRSKATLATSLSDQTGKPVTASLTVAVSAKPAFIEEVITPGSLLKKVRNAGISNWDLLSHNRLSETEVDLLLMAGPPIYKTAISPKPSARQSADDSLFYIHGRITNPKGESIANLSISLISKTGEGLFAESITNANGRFSFAVAAYPDSTQFILQTVNQKGKTQPLRIDLEQMPFPRFTTPAFLKHKPMVSTSMRMSYARTYADTTLRNGSGWLNPVKLQAKAKPFENDPRRLASGGIILTSEQLKEVGMGNVGTAVLRLPGVQLINGYLRFYGPDQFSGANANSEPMLMLDGNPMSLSSSGNAISSSPVIQFLNTLNPREIDFIEVLKGPEASIYGVRGGEGVIHVHSNSQVQQDPTAKDGNVYRFFRQGYAKPAVFPLVSFEQKETREGTSVDARSTLFWSENELTGPDGKRVFTFITPDVKEVYQVSMTGITAGGEVFYKTLSFTNR